MLRILVIKKQSTDQYFIRIGPGIYSLKIANN